MSQRRDPTSPAAVIELLLGRFVVCTEQFLVSIEQFVVFTPILTLMTNITSHMASFIQSVFKLTWHLLYILSPPPPPAWSSEALKQLSRPHGGRSTPHRHGPKNKQMTVAEDIFCNWKIPVSPPMEGVLFVCLSVFCYLDLFGGVLHPPPAF